MASKNYKYYQPNKMDLKDNYGDCAIRTICKAEKMEWLEAYDMMYQVSREVQCPMNCKQGFEHILKHLGYIYHPISNKKGSKRPTVDRFSKDNTEGCFVLVVANHYVCSENGSYYDTWDSGDCCLYGYWKKESESM